LPRRLSRCTVRPPEENSIGVVLVSAALQDVVSNRVESPLKPMMIGPTPKISVSVCSRRRHRHGDAGPRVLQHGVEVDDVVDELDRLAMPFNSRDLTTNDAVGQGSCLVDDHFLVDAAGLQLSD
jgi:hypothetical protein